MNIILASGSPRRREILEKIGVKPEVIVSNEEENPQSVKPCDVVVELATIKGESVYNKVKNERRDDFLIIAADTIVALDDEILGKPKSEEDAKRMLEGLSGRSHQVYSGVCIIIKNDNELKKLSFYEVTDVDVCELSTSEIDKYIATGEPMDKAGAYAIQGLFAPYISGIRGDFYNVMGFPISRICSELKKCKIILA